MERLAPILMTGMATALALLPIILGGDRPGHEIEHPMAVVIFGGLVTSTVLNLFVLPPLYLRYGAPRRPPLGYSGLVDQLEGARVLLVDDSAHARRRLAKILDAAGADVTAVASSGDALAALGGARFDVLVCDLRLADGYSLMRSIRGGAVAGSIAIRSIAMMAHAVTETRQKALDAGFDDFVPKLVGALLVPAVARLREPT